METRDTPFSMVIRVCPRVVASNQKKKRRKKVEDDEFRIEIRLTNGNDQHLLLQSIISRQETINSETASSRFARIRPKKFSPNFV